MVNRSRGAHEASRAPSVGQIKTVMQCYKDVVTTFAPYSVEHPSTSRQVEVVRATSELSPLNVPEPDYVTLG